MRKVAFLHDVEMDYIGGAELSNKQIIEEAKAQNLDIFYDSLQDFEKTKDLLISSDFAIINNIVSCDYEFELIDFLIENNINYVKWEHDYGLCAKRSIYCYVDSKVKNCCDNQRFKSYRNLFTNAKCNVFQSPLHIKLHKRLYGEAVANHLVLPPPINVKALKPFAEKNIDEVVFVGDLKFIKGGNALVEYAIRNPEKKIVVYGNSTLQRDIPGNVIFKPNTTNKEVLEGLGKAEYFFFKPVWFEPSGRGAAEAFLSGAKLICNDKIGTFSYDFFPKDKELAKKSMQDAPKLFWQSVLKAVASKKEPTKFKHVLVYKNYGGLGDRFISLPAINKLKSISEKVTLGVPSNLVNVFKRNTSGLYIKAIDDYKNIDFSPFDKVINLGNYPKSRRFDNEGVIEYETHYKVKQHALKHYIDAIATIHPDIDNAYSGYPYFKASTNTQNPYFTVHPGAGFMPKWWPTERYILLVKALLKKFPHYNCQVVLGPDDPDPKHFENIERVTLETGNLDAVEKCVSGASFHIGNDSGITHFAGVFNVPSVSFHGLTGPGAWATMAEETVVVWGKPGNCNLHCTYDVAMGCEHRICLSSITLNKALMSVYKVLQNGLDMKDKRIKYIVNPEITLEKVKKGFIIKTKDKELLLEFEKEKELKEFSYFIQEDIFQDAISQESIMQLLEALVNEELAFAVPV